jgi:hypothetical protein
MRSCEPYTPEQDKQLLALRDAGFTYAQIGERLGKTRNGIGQRVRWLKLNAEGQAQVRADQNRKRNKHAKFWTSQETELAEKLLKENASNELCLAMLGKTKKACLHRVWRARRDEVNRRSRVAPRPYVQETKIIPQELIEERNRRLTAPRSLTSIICGDPPPNCSALDRRKMERT